MASFVIRPRCCGPFVFSKRVKKSGGEEKSPGPALSPRTKTTKATCESAVMGIMQNYGHGGGGGWGEREGHRTDSRRNVREDCPATYAIDGSWIEHLQRPCNPFHRERNFSWGFLLCSKLLMVAFVGRMDVELL